MPPCNDDTRSTETPLVEAASLSAMLAGRGASLLPRGSVGLAGSTSGIASGTPGAKLQVRGMPIGRRDWRRRRQQTLCRVKCATHRLGPDLLILALQSCQKIHKKDEFRARCAVVLRAAAVCGAKRARRDPRKIPVAPAAAPTPARGAGLICENARWARFGHRRRLFVKVRAG